MVEPSRMHYKAMCWQHKTIQSKELNKVTEMPQIGIFRANQVLGTLSDSLGKRSARVLSP